MRVSMVVAIALLCGSGAAAVKIDIGVADIERALVIARSRDAERARFHAEYMREVNTPFVDRAELITEFRRVVLLAEERTATGDRQFRYSSTMAGDALKVWRRRVSVLVRVRFHPQNNYVDVPPVSVTADGHEAALIGVRREAVLALPAGRRAEFMPVLGAVVEGVFEAEALGQATRQFVVALDGKELGRVSFNLGAVE
jgi:hypothetical protein